MVFDDESGVRQNFMRTRLNVMIGLTRIIDAVAGPK